MDIRERRKQLGLNQGEFAEILGMKRISVYHWEKGRAPQIPGGLELALKFLTFQKRLGECPDVPKTPTGEEVKAAREELDLTQIELAEKLGVTQATVSRWEDGSPIQCWGIVALALQWLGMVHRMGGDPLELLDESANLAAEARRLHERSREMLNKPDPMDPNVGSRFRRPDGTLDLEKFEELLPGDPSVAGRFRRPDGTLDVEEMEKLMVPLPQPPVEPMSTET